MHENNKIKIIVDWDGTLNADDVLAKKLSEYKDNGVDISVCSDLYNQEKNQILKELGLDIPYIHKQFFYIDKGEVEFWESVIEQFKTEPDKLVVIDDNSDYCMVAQEAGLSALTWYSADKNRLDELDSLMKKNGYKPS